MFTLKKASRQQVKLRLNLSGPSGSGKTFSALKMAKGLVGDWSKIAVVDTENKSASLYSHLGEFNTIELTPPFTPERYQAAIKACIDAGMECVIIDSSSHEWNQLLDDNDKLAAAKYRGNTWSAWSETTPRHDKFLQYVLHCPVHIITCTRSKTETVMGEDKKVKKVGMKDVQREGWEYELTVSLNLDRDTHLAFASKDRTELFEGKAPAVITEETGLLIKQWCDTGEKVPDLSEQAAAAIIDLDKVTDLSDLPKWKAAHGTVITIPDVKKAAAEKWAALKEAAK